MPCMAINTVWVAVVVDESMTITMICIYAYMFKSTMSLIGETYAAGCICLYKNLSYAYFTDEVEDTNTETAGKGTKYSPNSM